MEVGDAAGLRDLPGHVVTHDLRQAARECPGHEGGSRIRDEIAASRPEKAG